MGEAETDGADEVPKVGEAVGATAGVEGVGEKGDVVGAEAVGTKEEDGDEGVAVRVGNTVIDGRGDGVTSTLGIGTVEPEGMA